MRRWGKIAALVFCCISACEVYSAADLEGESPVGPTVREGADASLDGAASPDGSPVTDGAVMMTEGGPGDAQTTTDGAANDGGANDAALPDADSGATRRVQCTTLQASTGGTPLGTSGGAAAYHAGFRFSLTAATTITRVGAHVSSSASPRGSVFFALIALPSATSYPTKFQLLPADVVASVVVPVTSSTGVVDSATVAWAVNPGNYALVVGTGLLGASSTGAVMLHYSGGCPSLPGADPLFLMLPTQTGAISGGSHIFADMR